MIQYIDRKVVTDYEVRSKAGDASVYGVKTDADRAKADRITRNVYKTLLSRGQKGCFIYCEDRALSDYIKMRLDSVKANAPALESTRIS